MNLTLVLTHDCNLRCHYCYAGQARSSVMSRETIDAALAFGLREQADGDTFQLGFFGGEPLLAWDALVYAHSRATETMDDGAFICTVTTNATLLNPEQAAWLHSANIYAGLSIDGNRAMHETTRPLADGSSSFDACMAGLQCAQEAGLRHEVICVVDPSNVQHTSDAVRFLCDDCGVERVSLNPNFYIAWDDAAITIFDREYAAVADFMLERYRNQKPISLKVLDGKIVTRLKDGYACSDRCGFGINEIAVAPSGRLYPCERLVGEDDGGRLCLGNVIDGFDEAKRLAVTMSRGNHDKECVDCTLRGRCMNWCGCINVGTTGQIDSTGGFVCHHEKTVIREADRIANQLFNEGNTAFLARFYER